MIPSKNIHVLPKLEVWKNVGDLVKDKYGDIHIFTKNDGKEYGKTTTKLNIYITSDEEIKEDHLPCYVIYNNTLQYISFKSVLKDANKECSGRVLLTRDQELIKDGVQAIDDEFLEWFVKNPSCEFVDVIKELDEVDPHICVNYTNSYKIITPQKNFYCGNEVDFDEQCPEQCENCNDATGVDYGYKETIEEAAEKFCDIPKKLSGDKYKFSAQDRLLYNTFIDGANWQSERMYSEDEVYSIIKMVSSMKESGKSDIEIVEYFEKNKKK